VLRVPSVLCSSRRFQTWGRVSLVGFVGMITRSIHSSPPSLTAPPGPTSARHEIFAPLRFRDGALTFVEVRGRRGACGACVLVLPALRERTLFEPSGLDRPLSFSGFCCGPRCAAAWRPRAVAIRPRLATLATKPFTPAAADGRGTPCPLPGGHRQDARYTEDSATISSLIRRNGCER
jgi:hypothetical protein